MAGPTRYTATREFNSIDGSRVISIGGTVGGTVTWAIEHNTGEWTDVHTWTVGDAPENITFGPMQRKHRFTVTGGATYAF